MSSKETKNQSRLYLSALIMLAAIAVLSTVTTTGNNVFAQSDSEENSNGNSDDVADNGNGNAETETETAAEEEDTSGGNSDTNGNDHTNNGNGNSDTETADTAAAAAAAAPTDSEERNGNGDNGNDDTNGNDHTNNGNGNSANVANNGNEGEGGFGDTQPAREGIHDNAQQTSGEGANQGGTVTDPTIPDDETGGDDTVTANCFGKVISHESQEHKDPESGEERLGEHSRDPLAGDADNETPRQGIGNQDQGHPAAHGAFNSQFDDDDAENVAENCN